MITSISTSYRNISNNFNPASFSLNRSDLSSNTSSMITGAESLILNSIRKNNKSLCFQKQNRKLKNDIKNLKKINIEHNSYRSLILQKSLVNLIKNGNNQSKFNEIKTPFLNDFYSKIKKESDNINLDSFLTQRISEQIYEKEKRDLSNFNKRMKIKIFLKKFIQDQKVNYKNKLIENKKDEQLIYNLNKKIDRISFLIKELDNILTLFSYVKYLQKIKIQMRHDYLLQYTQIDYLRNDINDLLIKVKVKADKLYELINIRNLLICIKEGIQLKDLPHNFTFYTANYQNVLDEILINCNNYNPKKPIKNIPTNLLEYLYIKFIKKMKSNLSKKYKNYLKLNYKIFKDEEEFIIQFSEIEKKLNDYLEIFLKKQKYNNTDEKNNKINININSNSKNNNNNSNNEIENFEVYFKTKKDILNKLKQSNQMLNSHYNKIKNEKKGNTENNAFEENDKKLELKTLNKLMLDSINNSFSPQDIKFLYNFNKIKTEKNYQVKNAYIFHTLVKNILELYKISPQYLERQHNFQIDEFNIRLKYINNIDKVLSNKMILKEINYFLKIYESAISYFFIDLNNIKKKQSSLIIYNSIKDKISTMRKRQVFKFRIKLENKLNYAKKEKIIEKHSKNIIRKHNIYFPKIPIIKLKKNKSQEKLIFRKNNFDDYTNNNINLDYTSLNY